MHNATGLTITNPLVLYRALVATNRIRPDPSQLRLGMLKFLKYYSGIARNVYIADTNNVEALHLQKLYDRLKDYEPAIEYRQRLNRVGNVLKDKNELPNADTSPGLGSRGIWKSLIQQKAKRDDLALTRVLNNHEAALQLDSPKGLMLHGEVGTGKSMLIDLFSDCLPTEKKRRWHFNTFMLETFSKLEQLRRGQSLFRNGDSSVKGDDYSMLWLARDLIKTSPILFLDEFQLPDRTASKIMANLMTNFFQLGGVLIATSNRMPDELAKAAGMEFVHPPPRFLSLSRRLGFNNKRGNGGGMFAGEGEFGQFLELLKARCDIWEMEGKQDYRRGEPEKHSSQPAAEVDAVGMGATTGGLSDAKGLDLDTNISENAPSEATGLPANYFIQDTASPESLLTLFGKTQLRATGDESTAVNDIPWVPATMTIYGRTVYIPRTHGNIAFFTFAEICATSLGPADYISIASTFHTLIVTDTPVLTVLLKNEARRFITLLDALYEARCKLLVTAAAGPDDIFFPETRRIAVSGEVLETSDQDAVYPETFSEVHQDLTAPFRPNVSSYGGEEPDYSHSRLQGVLADDALEDDPPNRVRRLADEERREMKATPNFGQTSTFIGDDERFAYKRAASRLWEMCGKKWWDRNEEGWWKPLSKEARRWETPLGSQPSSTVSLRDEGSEIAAAEGMGHTRQVSEDEDQVLFKHSASPFRTASEPPPKISWTHVWGTGVVWGKRAGAWGKGVEGLKDRKKKDDK
jgi:protein AFG1